MRLKHLLLLAALALAMPITANADDQVSSAAVTDSAAIRKAELLEKHLVKINTRRAKLNAGDENQSPVPAFAQTRARVDADKQVIIGGVNYELHTDGTAKVVALSATAEGLTEAVAEGKILNPARNVYLQTGNIVVPEKVEYNEEEYSVTSIGARAFATSYITSIELPASITELEQLDNVNTGSPLYILKGSEGTTWTGNGYPKGTGIFAECFTLKTAVIKCNVTSLGGFCFVSCLSLKNVTLPNTLTKIEEGEFAGCVSLQNFVIPENVVDIAPRAFYKTGIPAGTDLSVYANAVEYIPDVVKNTKENRFNLSSIESGAQSIVSDFNFAGMVGVGLNTITLPAKENSKGEVELESMAFFKARNLQIESMPASIKEIGEKAFHYTSISGELNWENAVCTGISKSNFVADSEEGRGDFKILVSAENKSNVNKNTEDFRIAKKQVREATGKLGTIVLGYDAEIPTGVTLYEVVGKTMENGEVKSLTIEQSEDTKVIKGKPYFFQTTTTATFVPTDNNYFYFPTETEEKVCEGTQGLVGVLDATQVTAGVYMLKDNTLYKAADYSRCAANRAYINMNEVPILNDAETRALSPKAMRFAVGSIEE